SDPPPPHVQSVSAVAFAPRRRDLALPQLAAARDVDTAVDLRRVAAGAPLGRGRPGAGRVRLAAGAVNFVDDHLLARADPAPETSRGNRLLMPHEAMPALLFHRVGNGGCKLLGGPAPHPLVTGAPRAL